MKGFERYDVQRWLDNGLSFHPESSAPAQTERRYVPRYIARMAIPFVRMAAFGLCTSVARSEVAWAGNAVAGALVFAARSPPVVWDSKSGRASAVDDFEAHASALLAQIQTGALTNVPSQTLMLATEVVGRYAATDPQGQPDWVAKVASEVAKLTD
jgi:hypothetical protein